MARSLLLVAALLPFAAGLALGSAISLPALAQPATVAAPADPAAIDLEAIPMKPVKGPLAVKGVAGEDDDAPRLGAGGKTSGGDAVEAENGGKGQDDGDFDE